MSSIVDAMDAATANFGKSTAASKTVKASTAPKSGTGDFKQLLKEASQERKLTEVEYRKALDEIIEEVIEIFAKKAVESLKDRLINEARIKRSTKVSIKCNYIAGIDIYDSDHNEYNVPKDFPALKIYCRWNELTREQLLNIDQDYGINNSCLKLIYDRFGLFYGKFTNKYFVKYYSRVKQLAALESISIAFYFRGVRHNTLAPGLKLTSKMDEPYPPVNESYFTASVS